MYSQISSFLIAQFLSFYMGNLGVKFETSAQKSRIAESAYFPHFPS
jgi:hypothetical protein